MRLRPKLRGKTLLLCALLVAAPVLAAWLMGTYDVWTSWRYRLHLKQAATEIAAMVEASADDEQIAAAGHQFEVYVRVLRPDGTVEVESNPKYGDGRFSRSAWFKALADFFHGPDGSPDLMAAESDLPPLSERKEVMSALAGTAASYRRTVHGATAFVFYRAVPLPTGGAVYVTRLSRRSARALYDHRYRLLKVTLLLLILAVIVAVLAGRAVVKPLERMRASVTAHLDAGAELDLGVDRRDEIGDLARAFEVFARRLRDRATRAATASAELAHDMKSPISAVLASAELLESGGADGERQRRIAAGIRRAAQHLDRSVQGFMSLAELDESLASAPRQPTDVGAIAAEVVDEIADHPQRQMIEIECDVEPAVVSADPERVAQMIRNLVDNAADFARSRVAVRVRRTRDAIEIAVEDDGPGVTGASRERVFERFFSGRAGSKQTSRGLGLAIVQTIAEAYGGKAELLDERPLGGAAFRVTLPRV